MLALATPATAAFPVIGNPPTPTIGSPSASPATVPSGAISSDAICATNSAAGVALSVTSSATYNSTTCNAWALVPNPNSPCTLCSGNLTGAALTACTNSGGNKFRAIFRECTEVSNKNLVVNASDGSTSTGLTGPSPFTGTLSTKVASDGLVTVTFQAQARENHGTRTDTGYRFFTGSGASCQTQQGSDYLNVTGAVTPSGSNPFVSDSAPTNDTYLLDKQAPTVGHALVGAPVSITQKGTATYNITALGGSAGTDYTESALASGPASLSATSGTLTFGAAASGIAPNKTEALGLTLDCDPTGTYNTSASIAAVDLCGQSWGTIYSSTASPDTFEVTADATCANLGITTVVTAPLLTDDYEGVECFTSKLAGNGKNKTVTDPGTVHGGAVVNLPAGNGTCTNTVTGLMLTLSKPSVFDWTMSGSSPAAHVFVGDLDGNALVYHYGTPLAEVTDTLLADGRIAGGTDNGDNDLDIDLSNLDVGCGAGEIPYGWTVYARAHVRLNRGIAPGTNINHIFSSSVVSNELPGPFSDDQTVTENPTSPLCVNGMFDD